MKVVIFSYHFLPLASAESYCTTRFASALARAGIEVHVVTMDWPQRVSRSVSDFLVDKRLKITRIPLVEPKSPPIFSRIKYLTHEWQSVNYNACIRTLRKILDEEGNPILVTRSFPWASFIVGWHCRRHAAKWVAHLSDPIPPPWEPRSTLTFTLRYYFARFWMKRVFRGADLISLTCHQAKRFFQEAFGEVFERIPTVVLTHIGEPPLPGVEGKVPLALDGRFIAHVGDFYADRGAREIAEAIDKLNADGFMCRFVQCGTTDPGLVDGLRARSTVSIYDKPSPDVAATVAKSASAVFVPDVNIPLDYVPFLPSKFAYQIFSDKPLVLYSKRESSLYELSVKYPNSGLYFADRDKPDALPVAIRAALEGPRNFDRTEIRKVFSRDGVVKEFLVAVKRMGEVG